MIPDAPAFVFDAPTPEFKLVPEAVVVVVDIGGGVLSDIGIVVVVVGVDVGVVVVVVVGAIHGGVLSITNSTFSGDTVSMDQPSVFESDDSVGGDSDGADDGTDDEADDGADNGAEDGAEDGGNDVGGSVSVSDE